MTIEGIKFEGGAESVQLPHNIQELEVLFCDFKVRSLADALPSSLDGSTSLERISIRYSEGIECIWSESSCAIGRVELPRGGAFSSLKRLSVYDCKRVEKLFTPCLLNGQLRNLEEIKIKKCDVLEEMFGGCELDDESGEINTGNPIISLELPKLKVLKLRYLPRLVSICKTALLSCNSIEKIRVHCCPQLKKLSITIVDEELRNGEPKIVVARKWWESLVWDNPHHKHILDPFVLFKFDYASIDLGYYSTDSGDYASTDSGD